MSVKSEIELPILMEKCYGLSLLAEEYSLPDTMYRTQLKCRSQRSNESQQNYKANVERLLRLVYQSTAQDFAIIMPANICIRWR